MSDRATPQPGCSTPYPATQAADHQEASLREALQHAYFVLCDITAVLDDLYEGETSQEAHQLRLIFRTLDTERQLLDATLWPHGRSEEAT